MKFIVWFFEKKYEIIFLFYVVYKIENVKK